jgi:hypothetical protein
VIIAGAREGSRMEGHSDGDHKSVLEAVRTAAVLSGLIAGLAIAVLFIYITYVYNLWAHAMRAEGPPGTPPP